MVVRDEYGIVDVLIGYAGSITEWGNVIDVSDFDTWTPELYAGLVIEIPNKVSSNTVTLSNYSLPNLYDLLTALTDTLDSVVVSDSNILAAESIKESYTVMGSEGIVDIVLNATGDLSSWGALLEVNNFNTWVPGFTGGEKIIIEGIIKNRNVISLLKGGPLSNANSINDFDAQINDLINKFADKVLFDDDFSEMQFDDDLETAYYN